MTRFISTYKIYVFVWHYDHKLLIFCMQILQQLWSNIELVELKGCCNFNIDGIFQWHWPISCDRNFRGPGHLSEKGNSCQMHNFPSVCFVMYMEYNTRLFPVYLSGNVDGLVQNSSISIANALETLQSCTNPSIWLAQCQRRNREGHYCDVIMNAIASQITSVFIVYSSVCSDADQR